MFRIVQLRLTIPYKNPHSRLKAILSRDRQISFEKWKTYSTTQTLLSHDLIHRNKSIITIESIHCRDFSTTTLVNALFRREGLATLEKEDKSSCLQDRVIYECDNDAFLFSVKLSVLVLTLGLTGIATYYHYARNAARKVQEQRFLFDFSPMLDSVPLPVQTFIFTVCYGSALILFPLLLRYSTKVTSRVTILSHDRGVELLTTSLFGAPKISVIPNNKIVTLKMSKVLAKENPGLIRHKDSRLTAFILRDAGEVLDQQAFMKYLLSRDVSNVSFYEKM